MVFFDAIHRHMTWKHTHGSTFGHTLLYQPHIPEICGKIKDRFLATINHFSVSKEQLLTNVSKYLFFRLLFLVAVESLTGLYAQFALLNEFVQCRNWPEEHIVRKILMPSGDDIASSVETYVISQFEGPHWVSSTQFHCNVNVFGRSIP